MKGGTSPSNVAIPTSHGSSIRRRASLKTQYALASQNTTTKKIARLRMTSHVPESKKLSRPSKIELLLSEVVVWARSDTSIKGVVCRPRTPPRTRVLRTRPQSRRGRAARLRATDVCLPPARAGRGEVGEQVQRPRHQ